MRLIDEHENRSQYITLTKHEFSLSEFTHGGNDCVKCIAGVVEGWVIAGAPRELSAQAREDAVLDVVFGSDVSELLVD